jgi:hypothetical protein
MTCLPFLLSQPKGALHYGTVLMLSLLSRVALFGFLATIFFTENADRLRTIASRSLFEAVMIAIPVVGLSLLALMGVLYITVVVSMVRQDALGNRAESDIASS